MKQLNDQERTDKKIINNETIKWINQTNVAYFNPFYQKQIGRKISIKLDILVILGCCFDNKEDKTSCVLHTLILLTNKVYKVRDYWILYSFLIETQTNQHLKTNPRLFKGYQAKRLCLVIKVTFYFILSFWYYWGSL